MEVNLVSKPKYNNVPQGNPRLRGFREELLPNKKQMSKIFLKVDGRRFAYNWALRHLMNYYTATKKVMKDGTLRKQFTQFKKDVKELARTERQIIRAGGTPIPINELPIDIRMACKYYTLQQVATLCEVSNNVGKQAIKDCCSAYHRFVKIQAQRSHTKKKPFASKKYNRIKRHGKEPSLYDMFAHPKFRSAKNPAHQKFFEDVSHIRITDTHIYLEKLSANEKTRSKKKIIEVEENGKIVKKKVPRFMDFAAVKLAEPGRIPNDVHLYNLHVTVDAEGRVWLGGCYDVDSYQEMTESEALKIENRLIRKNTLRRIKASDKWAAAKLIPKGSHGIGIDVGERKHAVTSDGKVFETTTYTEKMNALEERSKVFKRRMAHRKNAAKKEWIKLHPNQSPAEFYYHESKNYIKDKHRAYKYSHHRTNIRHEAATKIAIDILRKNPLFVSHEDLNIQGLMKNRDRAKKTAEALYGEIFRILEYRGGWQGIPVLSIYRFYPSSKHCPNCGQTNEDLGSSETFDCPHCHYKADRDYNASVNIHNYGVEMFNKSREILSILQQYHQRISEHLAELAYEKEQEEIFSLLG